MPRPGLGDYAPFYQRYVDAVTGEDSRQAIRQSIPRLQSFLDSVPAEKRNYAYAEGKWTVVQLLQHLADTERVFAYRALSFARGMQDPLPGFDENAWANAAPAAQRSITDLAAEIMAIRQTTIMLFDNFSDPCLERAGTASGHLVTVNALGFIMVGHIWHHEQIYQERYR